MTARPSKGKYCLGVRLRMRRPAPAAGITAQWPALLMRYRAPFSSDEAYTGSTTR
jgi:hypothetical protein